MKLTLLSTTLTFGLAFSNPHRARGSLTEWAPAGPDDFRGPCPMMNTLANHAFLNHNGKNLTQDVVVGALTQALNFNESVATIMFQQALIANPEPNATFFSLDDLNRHNILEHDASMSRLDAFFGNNHIFNQIVFDTTTVFWTADTLDANMLANGKISRQLQSKAFNPNYTFTSTTEQFSLGEVAAPILIFGDIPSATVNKSLVEFFFQNEKLPVELGWTKQANAISLSDVLRMTQVISNATSLITGSSDASHATKRRDFHFGFAF
ncbi:heme-thiolate peroxidase [Cudoniella acicularis]|uniref:Heme-thiolate peroxidase n=1 Tax=Cudoniella acicularis TaxID=354080 RepID=A0A8H4RDE7_9HELO|nr:heme-thiolate peroxidase [Cudoniella acicularis]